MAKKALHQGMGEAGSRRIATRARNADGPSAREASSRKSATLRQVPAINLKPHPLQPLDRHSEGNVRELMESIQGIGLQEPPLVRRMPDGGYVILAGHRRVRAWQLLALDGRVDRKIRAFVLTGITDREAIYIIAAEYCHRKEFSAVHTANVIGYAWRERMEELGREPTVRDMEDVIPWKRQSISDYLKIADALEDPRRRDLVHSMDSQKALLCEVLKANDIDTQIAALGAFATGGAAATRKILNGGSESSAKPVSRKNRKDGHDLMFRVRNQMSAEELEVAIAAAELLVGELREMLTSASG